MPEGYNAICGADRGMRSRLQLIDFPPLTNQQLIDIFIKKAVENNYQVNEEVITELNLLIDTYKPHPGFAYARTMGVDLYQRASRNCYRRDDNVINVQDILAAEASLARQFITQ
jgi:hypothetical protein